MAQGVRGRGADLLQRRHWVSTACAGNSSPSASSPHSGSPKRLLLSRRLTSEPATPSAPTANQGIIGMVAPTARAYFARKALHPMVGLCQDVANVGPVAAFPWLGGIWWFCRICASLQVFARSQQAY
jgi:hypothetical protein